MSYTDHHNVAHSNFTNPPAVHADWGQAGPGGPHLDSHTDWGNHSNSPYTNWSNAPGPHSNTGYVNWSNAPGPHSNTGYVNWSNAPAAHSDGPAVL